MKHADKGDEQARVTLALPADTWKRTRIAAVERDMRYQEVVAIALERYLDMLDRAAARAQERRKGGGKSESTGAEPGEA